MRLAFCGVIAALSVVVLFLTGIVPVATIALPAVAGCLLIAVVAETNVRYGFAVYLVSSLFSALLTPDSEAALLYIIFFWLLSGAVRPADPHPKPRVMLGGKTLGFQCGHGA